MDYRTFHMLTLLLPHRLSLETYQLRDALWKNTGDISAKILPPCIPLVPIRNEETIPDAIKWTSETLTVSYDILTTPKAILLPITPEDPIRRLRVDLLKRLHGSYDTEAGTLFGIPTLDSPTGIYLGSGGHSAAIGIISASPLPPLNDARLALIRCTINEVGTLNKGASWEILQQKHLVDRN